MYDDAQLACEEMVAAGITPDSIAFGTLFVALNKANRSEKVLQIEKSSRARGILFDDVAYTETLLACSRLKDWETALFLYEGMKKRRLRLTNTMVINLLSAVGRSGKLDRLHKVFLELQQQIGFVPTLQMYNILIDSYSRGLKWRKCLEVLGCIKKDILEPNWKTYEPILSCLSQLELWETYLEIYGEVLAQGMEPDYNILKISVTAYTSLGMEEEASLTEARLQGLRRETKGAVRGDVKLLRH